MRRNKVTKLIVPLLIFVICLAVYITKQSIALSKNENRKDETEIVVLPNEKSNVKIGLIDKLKSIKLNLTFVNNEVRYYKCWRK